MDKFAAEQFSDNFFSRKKKKKKKMMQRNGHIYTSFLILIPARIVISQKEITE